MPVVRQPPETPLSRENSLDARENPVAFTFVLVRLRCGRGGRGLSWLPDLLKLPNKKIFHWVTL